MQTTTSLTLPFNKPYITVDNNSSLLIYVTEGVYSTFIYYFLCIELVIMIPTIFGNILILVSTFKFRRLRKDIHILVANLAVSDLLVGVVLIPLDVILLGIRDLIHGDTKYLCLTTLTLNITFLLSSILNLCLISIERYVAIIHPLAHSKRCTEHRLLKMIAGSWIIAILFGALPILGWNNWGASMNCDPELVFPMPYRVLMDSLLFVILIANTVMYTRVVRTALRQMQRVNMEMNQFGDRKDPNHSTLHKDFRRTKVMIIILGVFIFCWSPYCICMLVNNVIDSQVTVVVGKFLFQLGILNSSLNWLIYGYKNKEFHKAFKLVLRCSKVEQDNSLMMTSSTGNSDKSRQAKINKISTSTVMTGISTKDKMSYTASENKKLNFVQPRPFNGNTASDVVSKKNVNSIFHLSISKADKSPMIRSKRNVKYVKEKRITEQNKNLNTGSDHIAKCTVPNTKYRRRELGTKETRGFKDVEQKTKT